MWTAVGGASLKSSATTRFLLVACLLGNVDLASGQGVAVPPVDSSPKQLTYEVVSIKCARQGDPGFWQSLPDGFRIQDMPLESLLRAAYGVLEEYRIVGVPEWLKADPYDVTAKVNAETAEAWAQSPGARGKQEPLMNQSLFADRFGLKTHRETREMRVYDLVIAPGGLKMKEAPADEQTKLDYDGKQETARAVPIDNFVINLSSDVGRIVIDKTGLAGKKFDFALRWTQENRQTTPDSGPSIFTALQEQLGLKLVSDTGKVDVLVIDQIERPSPN
jgi:uncharacterized protein (TIGR03435 family)